MKKISTITFHASYNYGSCLQAYALQEYVKHICNYNCDYKIINLRTDIQKNKYKCIFEKTGIKNNIKKMIFWNKKKEILKKQENFEKFIGNYLQLTKEFNKFEELQKETWSSEYYIAGSDQLWNLQAQDFDWANYLEFIDNGKKISYAASWGPKPQTWNEEEKERAKKDLERFEYLSVRENGSFDNVVELLGKKPEINVDPTLLLDKSEWKKIINKERIISFKYIFLYNLKGKEYIDLAKKISNELKIPVVVSKFGNKYELIYGFKKRYDVGPLEFLNLIENAELVLSSSFHGTIFSILLNKPFFALKGMNDFRISTILEKMGLENRSIDFEDYKTKCKEAFNIDFTESEKLLEIERKKSEEYLKKALDIE